MSEEEKKVEEVDFTVTHTDTHVVASIVIDGKVEFTLGWLPEDARNAAANLTNHSIRVEMGQP